MGHEVKNNNSKNFNFYIFDLIRTSALPGPPPSERGAGTGGGPRGYCHTCCALARNYLSRWLKLPANEQISRQGCLAPVAGQIRSERNPFSGDSVCRCDVRANGGGWGGVQVVQRSYFIVPSLNRDTTQSGERQEKQKLGHWPRQQWFKKYPPEKLDAFFTTSRQLPANSLHPLFFKSFLSFNKDLTMGYCSNNFFSH